MIVPIGEPDGYYLPPNVQRVKELLDKGKSIGKIMRKLHMAMEDVHDAVYEIRKWEAVMGKKPKFNAQERAELLRLHNEERYSIGKLAAKFGCSQTAVRTALSAAKYEAEDEPKKGTFINPEFDAAVDEMIAEAGAADAEDEPEPIKQTTEPAEMTVEHTVEIPDSVIKAVEDKIMQIEDIVRLNTERI